MEFQKYNVKEEEKETEKKKKKKGSQKLYMKKKTTKTIGTKLITNNKKLKLKI